MATGPVEITVHATEIQAVVEVVKARDLAVGKLQDVADYLDQISDQCLAPPYPVPVPFWVLKIRHLIGHSTSAQSRNER